MVLLSTTRAKKIDGQRVWSFVSSALLLVATGVAAGLVVTGLLPETSSSALFRQTILAPNLALICLRGGCGCDKRPLTWVQEATKRSTPILVVLDRKRITEKEFQDFRRVLPSGNIAFHYTDSSPLLKRYAPSGESTLTLTHFGIFDTQSTKAGAANLSAVKGANR